MNRTVNMHFMTLAVPTRNPEPNSRRDFNPKNHLTARLVRRELLPLLASHREGGAAKSSGYDRGVLGLLVEREQHRRAAYSLILLVKHREQHRIIVNTDVLVGVPRSNVVDNLGISEAGFLGQTRNGEGLDVESGAVGA